MSIKKMKHAVHFFCKTLDKYDNMQYNIVITKHQYRTDREGKTTMICQTIEQMQRVANAGAIKMHRQGYTYNQNDVMSDDTQNAFDVVLPEAFQREGIPSAHLVTISPDESPVCTCTCQFYANHHFGFDTTCKHIEYVLAEERDRIQTEAAELAEAEREDAMNLIESNDRAHVGHNEVVAGSEWWLHNRPCHLPAPSVARLEAVQNRTLATLKDHYLAGKAYLA